MPTDQNQIALYQLAYQLSQEKLSSQSDAAIGADARAMSFAGLCLTASALLVGLAKESYEPLAILAGASALTLAAGFSGYSARPLRFRFPGANFSDLATDLSKNVDLVVVLEELGGYSEKHINENNRILIRNSALLVTSYKVSILAMIIAIAPQILTALSI